VPSLGDDVGHLRQNMSDLRLQRRLWTRQHGDDHPEIRDWTWPL
jgi:xylulose-5-phosphate/fructose-6-phosphate phosphoketolase